MAAVSQYGMEECRNVCVSDVIFHIAASNLWAWCSWNTYIRVSHKSIKFSLPKISKTSWRWPVLVCSCIWIVCCFIDIFSTSCQIIYNQSEMFTTKKTLTASSISLCHIPTYVFMRITCFNDFIIPYFFSILQWIHGRVSIYIHFLYWRVNSLLVMDQDFRWKSKLPASALRIPQNTFQNAYIYRKQQEALVLP